MKQPPCKITWANFDPLPDDAPEDDGGSYSINFERFVGRDYMLYDKNQVQGNNGELVVASPRGRLILLPIIPIKRQ